VITVNRAILGGIIVVGGIVAAIGTQAPEIRRYLAIRKM
jgi:hypothetical protein